MRVKKYDTWEEMNRVREEIREELSKLKTATSASIIEVNRKRTRSMQEINEQISRLKHMKQVSSDEMFEKINVIKADAQAWRNKLVDEIRDLESMNQDLIVERRKAMQL